MHDTASDGGGGDPVFRLIYRSHCLIDPSERTAQLGAIFTAARRHNRSAGITGALMLTDDAFVQALEGETDGVHALFEQIKGDPRHDQVSLLSEEAEVERVFGRWAMAKVAADGGPDIRLLSNAHRGEIVAAPRDPSITPAQEAVLATMRDALALGAAGG